MPIYEIIMLEDPITIDIRGFPEYGHAESVGFYYEEETALKAIRENWCDVNDGGIYNAAIVEKKEPGLYPLAKQTWYFIFDKETKSYFDAKLPKEMEHYQI